MLYCSLNCESVVGAASEQHEDALSSRGHDVTFRFWARGPVYFIYLFFKKGQIETLCVCSTL